MIGLPTETDEDIKGIADTAQKIVDIYYSLPNKPKGRGVTVTISLATFVPKPFTPFQWEKQISLEEINRKQQYLKSLIKSKKIKLNYHDGKTSVIEGVFSRGDRRLGKVLLRAHEKGSMLEAWDEHFSYDRWLECLSEEGLTIEEFTGKRNIENPLPWEIRGTYANDKNHFQKNRISQIHLAFRPPTSDAKSDGESGNSPLAYPRV